MLVSMTGFGESQSHSEEKYCAVSARSVNNRFLKVIIRLPESHANLEGDVDKFVRKWVRRGTINITIRMARRSRPQDYCLNRDVLQAYLSQLHGLAVHDGGLLGHLLALPGVIEETPTLDDTREDWPLVRDSVQTALKALDEMRRLEGAAMQEQLTRCADAITGLLDEIEQLAPEMVKAYRDRVHERVNALLADKGGALESADLIREVSIFADRCDIAEEIVRCRSHVNQFRTVMDMQESAGRTLEFLVQEMHREANTIGSKAADVEISRLVVNVKGEIERVRELIQNVE